MVSNREKFGNADLSALELAVMSVIWELGECGSREVIDAYNARAARELADTTIRTIVANLRRKGYVEPVPTIERGMRLRPAVAREGGGAAQLPPAHRAIFRRLPRPGHGLPDRERTSGRRRDR